MPPQTKRHIETKPKAEPPKTEPNIIIKNWTIPNAWHQGIRELKIPCQYPIDILGVGSPDGVPTFYVRIHANSPQVGEAVVLIVPPDQPLPMEVLNATYIGCYSTANGNLARHVFRLQDIPLPKVEKKVVEAPKPNITQGTKTDDSTDK